MSLHNVHLQIFLAFIKVLSKTIFSIACILFLIKTGVVSYEEVAGNSMNPTFKTAEKFISNKISLYFHNPQRGEIVQVIEPSKNNFVIKRVIGLPGETLFFKNGYIFIASPGLTNIDSAQKIEEPYIPPFVGTMVEKSTELRTFTLQKNQYFVMGDNRMHSTDSRAYGPVERSRFIGSVMGLHGQTSQKKPQLGLRYEQIFEHQGQLSSTHQTLFEQQ
jgi:signal peptidase I